MDAHPRRPVPAGAAWGLFVGWALHDAEEPATLPGWARRARPRLTAALPWVPERVWDRLTLDRDHTAGALAVMGAVMPAASADGARTGGRSAFYRTALAGFGPHALTHVAASAALRTYTPGVVTAPLVVAPFAVWAHRRLKEAGVPPAEGAAAWALPLFPATAAAAHGLAPAVLRLARGRRGADRRGPHRAVSAPRPAGSGRA
ncbi:HXXEE domain-containing protein [Nocardiopsis suaedae]|uniref:HXXEE domain-containing protein n=1 Tax=Nocardiopsis suaedae TaxID=3018444 RepID=A0ABT4TN50_9ACTN|nr:HXXEE domain-containing protein [Nocardiopsis suaedae]MDA2806122.1 HXXEE domain-containing protein [Nocardiopsis suaedae]